ncbi:hypothetical protein GJ496_007429 [Pomphorhynchus laevis]|nr:hypothetical protein GJ496_007429 [Pomphorhynchus laevis]
MAKQANHTNLALVDFKGKYQLVWNSLWFDNVLIVTVPDHLSAGAKDSFVALLDYAELSLKVEKIYLLINNVRTDRDTVLKTFSYYEFFPTTDQSISILLNCCQSSSDYICLCYNYD